MRTDVYIAFAARIMNMCCLHQQILTILLNLEQRIVSDMETFVNLADVESLAYDGFCDYVKLKARIKGGVIVVLKVSDILQRDVSNLLMQVSSLTANQCNNTKFVEVLADTLVGMTGIASSLGKNTQPVVLECTSSILKNFQGQFEQCANKKTLFRLRDLCDICHH